MTPQLDTTGTVDAEKGQHIALAGQLYIGIGWGILSPFTQGYIEALFDADLHPPSSAAWNQTHHLKLYAVFSDLAPETLARIIADCEAIQATFPVSPNRAGGWQAWCVRRDGGFDMGGKWPGLPPLTVQLGDDGKVRFA